MKPVNILAFLCMHYLTSAFGAGFALPDGGGPALAVRAPSIGTGLLNQLEGLANDPNLKAVKATAKEAAAAIEHQSTEALEEAHQILDRVKGKLQGKPELAKSGDEDYVDKHTIMDDEDSFVEFGNIMKACVPHDCGKKFFLSEAVRWVKKALEDVGVFISEHPFATAAFLIGVSVLGVLIISGPVIPTMLEVIGFGARGPIKNTIAAVIQRVIGPVQAGSVFARLQSAAMGGAAMQELRNMAIIAFTGLLTAGALKLGGVSRQPLGQSTDLEPKEWRAWEVESRTNFSSKEASQVERFWGSPTPGGCIAYGYREYRASIWYVPEGMDLLTACARTPAVMRGLGFKKPLGCTEDSNKGVIGTWYVQTNGTDCMPRWGNIEDEGCMIYGHRRKFARLFDLGLQDNWTGVCESTPALIDGKNYDGPSYCEDKGVWGIYGVFDVTDQQCECSCIPA